MNDNKYSVAALLASNTSSINVLFTMMQNSVCGQ